MNYNLCLQHVLSEASEKQAPQPGCVRVVLQLLRRGEKVFTAPRRSSWQAGRRRSDRRSRVGRDCSAADGSMLISMSGCCTKTTDAPFFVKTKDTQLQFICILTLISRSAVHHFSQFPLLKVFNKADNRSIKTTSYGNIWLGFHCKVSVLNLIVGAKRIWKRRLNTTLVDCFGNINNHWKTENDVSTIIF